MSGYIDLHSHWVADVDDGAQRVEDGVALVHALWDAGFEQVIATPHMRSGMFDNTRDDLIAAFEMTSREVAKQVPSMRLGLGCEHFLDDIVFDRILHGGGIAYPGDHAILVEFSGYHVPAMLKERLYSLRCKGFRAVIAHPERYVAWLREADLMEELVDLGVVLLLDVGSLAGQYGQAAQSAAEKMLDAGLFYAACSDAHALEDVQGVVMGIERMKQLIGMDEALFLLRHGPQNVLSGKVEL